MQNRSTATTRCTLAVGLVLAGLTTWTPCLADLTWFDPSDDGTQPPSFADLALSYNGFIGEPTTVIDFGDLNDGAKVPDTYFDRFGVTLGRAASGQRGGWPRVYAEGGSDIRDLTGYDGSYMPDGDLVLMPINGEFSGSPFTIGFDVPVASVGGVLRVGPPGQRAQPDVDGVRHNGAVAGRACPRCLVVGNVQPQAELRVVLWRSSG